MPFEEKLSEAARLIEEVSQQLRQFNLLLNFEIKITYIRRPSGTSFATEPGENFPPSK